jgi:hypothetical protein
VFSAIHDSDPSPDLLALKYLEALPAMADGRATKIFLPAESTGLLGALGGIAELFADVKRPASARRRPRGDGA